MAAVGVPPEMVDGFAVHCLASGSSANCVLVTTPEGALLIDAGIGVRTLRTYLDERGVSAGNLHGICVTHEHGDHIAAAIPLACRWKAPVVSTSGTLGALVRADSLRRSPPARTVLRNDEISLGPFVVRSFPVSHDAAEPCGYRVEWRGHAVALATDTGVITPEWRAAAVGCELLVVEANHDIERLRLGPYPVSLKRRILSADGHLDNRSAAEWVLAHTSEHGPTAVWWAHLSETNNTPGLVRKEWETAWKSAGLRASPAATAVAGRDVPSLVHRPGGTAVQRTLF